MLSILTFLVYLLSATPGDHAIYLSVVEVNHVVNEQSVSIRIKVFSDDLQDVLRNHKNENNPDVAAGETAQDQLAQEYFNQNLKIAVDSTPLKLKLVSITEENDATFLQFESSTSPSWTSIDINAPYFTELFPTQINTFKVTYGGKKYYARTGKGATQTSITLN